MIVFDRRIRLAWLEAVAERTVSGMPDAEIRAGLDLLLEGEVTGKAKPYFFGPCCCPRRGFQDPSSARSSGE
jgi:hypothetical protein